MINLEVLNPVADTLKEEKSHRLAPRLPDLTGKTIGLFWNGKASGDTINKYASELIANRFANVHFKEYLGSVGMDIKPSYIRRATTQDVDTMVRECDAVIGALCD